MKRTAIPMNPKKYKRFRNALPPDYLRLWDVMVLTGLRLSDALRLRWSDVARGCITEAKTKKKKSIESLHAQCSGYDKCRKPNHDALLFPSPRHPDRPLTRQAAEYAFKNAAKDAGYKYPLNAHSARKLYAQNLYAETGDIVAVQKAMNHKDVATTCVYLFIAPKE